VGNNSRGLAGVAWSVKIISCKAFNSSGSGSGAAIISCLNYFVTLKNNFGFNIVATNNSYGGFPYSQSMLSAIEATKAANIVFVAGAGNQSSNNDTNPFYPANYAVDNIISVGAVDSAANKASFSNFGLSVDISAPGVGVLTTLPNNQYGYVQGTSMSAPHITGTVALLMAYHPTYHYSQAINSILNTGTIISGLSGKNSTSAIVNTEAALKYDAPLPTPTVTPIPSMTPTTTATSTPTIPPDNRSTTLKISSNATRTKVTVTCSLVSTINGIGRPLSNYKVFLNTKGIKTPKAKITNKNGLASFVLHPLRKLAFTARCNSKISDIDSDYIVRSRTIKLRTK
jgi:subtilisin family serine protease